MGHTKEIFTFPLKTSEKAIIKAVTDWSYSEVDLRELDYPSRKNYSIDVYFKYLGGKIFNSYDAAREYAEGETDRDAVAVKYKEYPPLKPTKAMKDLERRINEYNERIAALEKPHYQNVKQATVKCKCCGAVLPTKYCGTSYKNNCPVCNADLRPDSTLSKVSNYRATIADLKKSFKAEAEKLNQKNASKAEIKWLVCCDVHT